MASALPPGFCPALAPPEGISIGAEINPIPNHNDAFRPKPQPLLETIFAGQKNPALRAQNAVPGNSFPAGT
jgi:hypothetical protein